MKKSKLLVKVSTLNEASIQNTPASVRPRHQQVQTSAPSSSSPPPPLPSLMKEYKLLGEFSISKGVQTTGKSASPALAILKGFFFLLFSE